MVRAYKGQGPRCAETSSEVEACGEGRPHAGAAGRGYEVGLLVYAEGAGGGGDGQGVRMGGRGGIGEKREVDESSLDEGREV